MNSQLTEALRQLDLHPGQIHRVAVNGHQVEIRVLPAEEVSDFALDTMVDLWVNAPEPPVVHILHPSAGPMEFPDPPILPADFDETE
jgi:hypothetical protein